MGRLAGPARYAEGAYEATLERLEAERRRLAAITPFVHPAAGRRQMALLWYLSQRWGGPSMTIGWRNAPPLTDDMRALIKKGHLVLRRTWREETESYGPPGTNHIELTAAGAEALSRGRISDADKHYVEMAIRTGVLR